MSANFYQALSHLVLAGTGVYCLKTVYGGVLGAPQGCFAIVFANNILQFWRTGNPSYGDKVYDLCKLTREIQDLFILPLITTSIWLNYSYSWEYAYAHTVAALFPMASYLFDKRSYELEHLIVLANLTSLGLVSYLHDNYWGISATITYALDYYLRNDNSHYDLPYTEVSNYILCFFSYFSLKALLD